MNSKLIISKMFWVLLLIFGSSILAGCGGGIYPPSIIWEPEIKRFEFLDALNRPEENRIVFVGSSSIRKWNTLKQDMSPLPIIQRGFGGATMNDVAHFAERIVTPYKPDLIVVYAGSNDIDLYGVDPNVILEKSIEFIDTVQVEQPNTPIFFISIKPSVDSWERWPIAVEANELLFALTETDPLLHYIDVASHMLDENGVVNADLFVDDGLHLNAKGYAIWTSIIKPVLEEAFTK